MPFIIIGRFLADGTARRQGGSVVAARWFSLTVQLVLMKRHMQKASPYVQGWFASTILWSRGEIAKKMLEPMCEVPEVMEAFQEYDSYMKN